MMIYFSVDYVNFYKLQGKLNLVTMTIRKVYSSSLSRRHSIIRVINHFPKRCVFFVFSSARIVRNTSRPVSFRLHFRRNFSKYFSPHTFKQQLSSARDTNSRDDVSYRPYTLLLIHFSLDNRT